MKLMKLMVRRVSGAEGGRSHKVTAVSGLPPPRRVAPARAPGKMSVRMPFHRRAHALLEPCRTGIFLGTWRTPGT